MKIKVECERCGNKFKVKLPDQAQGYNYTTHTSDSEPYSYSPGKENQTTERGTFEEEVTCPKCGAKLHVDYNIKKEEPRNCSSWVCLWKENEPPARRGLY